MRIHSKWCFLAVGAVLGLLAGRLTITPQADGPSPGATSESGSTTARGKSPTAASNAERTKSARIAEIREMATSKDYKARETFINGLQSRDLPDLLAVFLADAGLDGIDYKQKEMLEKAVNQWVAEDVSAALAWAASLPQSKLRRYFQKTMLGQLSKTDPFDAVNHALAIEAGDAEFDASDVVCTGVSSLAKKSGNEGKIAELVKKTSSKNSNSSSGLSQTFAEDFSHETLLNELADIRKQGLKFRFAPTGMLEAWAKRDPEAAHVWFTANGEVGFEEWQDILSGVAASSGHQASGQWFLGKFIQADGATRKTMTKAFGDTYPEPAARMVLADALARQMAPDLAGEFVEQVLQHHMGIWSDKQTEGLSLLNWYPTPEARADVMVKYAGYRGVDKMLERFPESRLAPHGVTRASLEAAIQREKASH